MKKTLKQEWIKELNIITIKNGYLKKEEIIYFSKKFSINEKLLCKLLKESKIPYRRGNLFSILNAYSIFEIEGNTIELENFLLLGDWKERVFKYSKIKVKFVCKECEKESKAELRKMFNRVYNKMQPICQKCICLVTSREEDWLKKISITQKEYKNRPENKQKQSELTIKYWSNDNYRKKISETMKEVWQREGYKKKRSEDSKIACSGKEHKEHMSKATKKNWESEEYRDKITQGYINKEGVENAMQTDETFEKHRKSCLKLKEYIFPSGRKEKVQGYENFAIDFLLKTYKEEDIVVNNNEIISFTGRIFYEDDNNKKRRYFPDIFIISENRIVEVKSIWTYNKHLKINICKKKKCEELGFKFDFMIFDRKGNEVKE